MTNATGDDLSQMARALEKSGDYRVLRRLVPRDVMTPVPVDEQIKIGVLLDVETTGLDAKTDAVDHVIDAVFRSELTKGMGTCRALQPPPLTESRKINSRRRVHPDEP